MRYSLDFSENALEDLEKHRQSGDEAILKKIERLFLELMEHPKTGTGKPEKLKHDKRGLYSRRINKKHRLVYSIEEQKIEVYVLSAFSHYGQK